MKTALSIAGLDPSGGAGLLADIKVFVAHGVYAMGVLTATTSQNTKGLYGMELISPEMISNGIKAIFDDIKVNAIKIGVVPSVDIIKAVADSLKALPECPEVVLDPVMSCKNGDIWLEGESKKAIVEHLFPLASIITPNRFEAKEITGISINSLDDAKKACEKLLSYGTKAVYLKAGDINGVSLDLFYDGKNFVLLDECERLETIHTHGSGCSLSSAIAANIAKGDSYIEAVKKAKNYIFKAIKNAEIIGGGCNPINHFIK
ncbi:MAG: bifunctional hydroxymethylpyrimidine kinase/phosphomethylpyrimidine kinase [Campylobacter sp.]|nr:bifunctional hydroxymethylpyrimidine kinase/phosphomethylpyrimidine kinase [Campylobacter sp.]